MTTKKNIINQATAFFKKDNERIKKSLKAKSLHKTKAIQQATAFFKKDNERIKKSVKRPLVTRQYSNRPKKVVFHRLSRESVIRREAIRREAMRIRRRRAIYMALDYYNRHPSLIDWKDRKHQVIRKADQYLARL